MVLNISGWCWKPNHKLLFSFRNEVSGTTLLPGGADMLGTWRLVLSTSMLVNWSSTQVLSDAVEPKIVGLSVFIFIDMEYIKF